MWSRGSKHLKQDIFDSSSANHLVLNFQYNIIYNAKLINKSECSMNKERSITRITFSLDFFAIYLYYENHYGGFYE